jgi:YVTN family beta-propeller protein
MILLLRNWIEHNVKTLLQLFVIASFSIVVINAQSNKAYITNFNDDFISVIDLNSFEKIADIKTGKNPHGVDVSSDGKTAIVSNTEDNTASIIDCATNKAISIVPVGNNPKRLVIEK